MRCIYSTQDFMYDFGKLLQCVPDVTLYDYNYLNKMSQKQLRTMMKIFTTIDNADSGILKCQDNISDIIYLCSNIGHSLTYCFVSDLNNCRILTFSTFNYAISQLLIYSDTRRMFLVALIHSITKLNRKIVATYINDIVNICHDEEHMKLLMDTSDILYTDVYGPKFFHDYFVYIFKLSSAEVLSLNMIIDICTTYKIRSGISNISAYEMIICSGSKCNVIPDILSLEVRKNMLVALRNSYILTKENIEKLLINTINIMTDIHDGYITEYLTQMEHIILKGTKCELTQSRFDTLITKKLTYYDVR